MLVNHLWRKVFVIQLESQLICCLFQYSVSFNYRFDPFYFIKAAGENEVLDCSCIDWTACSLVLIVRVIPILVYLQLIFEYSLNELFNAGEFTVFLSFIDNPLTGGIANELDT